MSDADKLRFAMPLVSHPASYFVRHDVRKGGLLPADEQPLVVSVEDITRMLDRLPSDLDEQCEHDWPMEIASGDACMLGCGATRG